MKNINIFKSFLMVAILGFLTLSLKVTAQDKPAKERASDLTNTMACELELFKSQIPEINAINLEAALKMDSAKIEAKGNWTYYHYKGKMINKARNIELRDALTPDQFALYERISKGDHIALKKTAECRKQQLSSK